jgi:hypothetical protein
MRSSTLFGIFFLGFFLALSFGVVLKKSDAVKSSTPRYSLSSNINKKEELLVHLKEELKRADSPKASYNYLRSENLAVHPELQLAVDAELRSEAIQKLLSKFRDVDWILWKENLSNYSNEKSEARIWLDKIKIVNFELGRYLETSALLLSGLYQASNVGKVFSAEEELYELSTEAASLFQLVTPKAYSPRTNLDVTITSDPSFHMWLEQLRAQFVVNYAKKQPKQLETQLMLLASVKDEFLTSNIVLTYAQLINFATTEISPKYRLELKEHYFQNGREKDLLGLSDDFSRAFENFYISCVKDAIETNSVPRAKSLLLQYGQYFPNSKMVSTLQEQVTTLESKNKEEQLVGNVPSSRGAELKSKVGFSDYLAGISSQASLTDIVEQVGFWLITVLLIALTIIKIIPFLLLLLRKERIRRERKYAAIEREKTRLAEERKSEEKDNIGNMVSITTPLNAKGRPYSKTREKKIANS